MDKSNLGHSTIDKALQGMVTDTPLSVRISGNCMAPVLKDQDLVKVQRQQWYWPGDILVLRLGDGRLVGHRLIGIYLRRKQLRFLTRGDNAQRPDGSVCGEQILGKILSKNQDGMILSPRLFDRFKAILILATFTSGRIINKLV